MCKLWYVTGNGENSRTASRRRDRPKARRNEDGKWMAEAAVPPDCVYADPGRWHTGYGAANRTYTALVISIVLACVVCVGFFKSFTALKTRLSVSRIRVIGFESRDSWLLGYVASYLFPMVCLSIEDLSLPLCMLLSIIV